MRDHARGHKHIHMRASQAFARHLFMRGMRARMRESMRRHLCNNNNNIII